MFYGNSLKGDHTLVSKLETWLEDFSSDADSTDLFQNSGRDHVPLLALGLIGEMGDILTEIKKDYREKSSASGLKERLEEEIGDFLWYYVRIVSIIDNDLIKSLPLEQIHSQTIKKDKLISDCLSISIWIGKLMSNVLSLSEGSEGNLRDALFKIWDNIKLISTQNGISLTEVAKKNILKRRDRWKSNDIPFNLFDEIFPVEEQLPRKMDFDFFEKKGTNGKPRVFLSSCGIHIGDPLTDNSSLQDDYRYHDIFHLGFMTYLGWSPVFRGILRCKRKSNPDIDENQDGARASITEEAISAMVFRRAQELNFFQGVKTIEYDLLKTIRMLVKGLEVEAVPLGQWERSILVSYEIFRELMINKGGKIQINLIEKTMTYLSLTHN